MKISLCNTRQQKKKTRKKGALKIMQQHGTLVSLQRLLIYLQISPIEVIDRAHKHKLHMRVHNDQIKNVEKKNCREVLRICCRIDLCRVLKTPKFMRPKKRNKREEIKNCATNSVFPERLYTEVTQHCSVSLIKINPSGAGTKLNEILRAFLHPNPTLKNQLWFPNQRHLRFLWENKLQ